MPKEFPWRSLNAAFDEQGHGLVLRDVETLFLAFKDMRFDLDALSGSTDLWFQQSSKWNSEVNEDEDEGDTITENQVTSLINNPTFQDWINQTIDDYWNNHNPLTPSGVAAGTFTDAWTGREIKIDTYGRITYADYTSSLTVTYNGTVFTSAQAPFVWTAPDAGHNTYLTLYSGAPHFNAKYLQGKEIATTDPTTITGTNNGLLVWNSGTSKWTPTQVFTDAGEMIVSTAGPTFSILAKPTGTKYLKHNGTSISWDTAPTPNSGTADSISRLLNDVNSTATWVENVVLGSAGSTGPSLVLVSNSSGGNTPVIQLMRSSNMLFNTGYSAGRAYVDIGTSSVGITSLLRLFGDTSPTFTLENDNTTSTATFAGSSYTSYTGKLSSVQVGVLGTADLRATAIRMTTIADSNGNQVVTTQQAAVTAPSGGSTIDSQARTAIGDLIARLRAHGLIA